MKIGDLFDIYGGNQGLYNNLIYENSPMNDKEKVKVISSSLNDKNQMGYISKNTIINNMKLKYFEGEPILVISRKGNPGKIQYFDGTEAIAITETAYVLSLKKQFKDIINLYWFKIVGEQYTNQCVSGENNGTFSKDLFLKVNLKELPSIEKQNEIVECYESLEAIKYILSDLETSINELFRIVIDVNQNMDYRVYRVGDIFLTKRGTVISEETIYNNNDKDGVPIYSSQTKDDGCMGRINRDYYLQTEKKGYKNTITWTTDGVNAGKFYYRDGEYLFTNVCGQLYLRDNVEMNSINLKYVTILLNSISKNEINACNTNSKLMSNQVEELMLYLPSIEFQNLIVNEYERLDKMKMKIKIVMKEVNDLLEYTII